MFTSLRRGKHRTRLVAGRSKNRAEARTHFIINSVSCETGKKYHSNLESLNALRAASDKLCKQYGLSVVRPKQKKKEHRMNDREYRAYDKGDSWKMDLEICIDECMTMARDREHFLKLMEWSGYGVRWTKDRKYITYTTPDDPRSYPASLGTGAAYLAADLWELMDEDEPVEDCTTMPHHQERKKNHGPVMGGM